MSLPGTSVRRPVATAMVTLIVVVLGLFALSRLRIDLLPAVEMPTLTVSTGYEGADPEVVERLVTRIAEEIIATVPGVVEMESTSSEGSSRISLTFAWGTDIDVAAQEVRARLEEELSELPDDVDRPQLRKFNIASFPVVLLGVYGRLDPVELNDIVERQLRDRFARLAGVAQVDLWGGYEREVRIALDPDRLSALGVSLGEIVAAIRDTNIDLPAGSVVAGRHELTLRAPASYLTIADIAATVVAVRDEAVITLRQVAEVIDTHRRLDRVVRVDGELGIRVAVRKEADANTVEVARRILDEIDAVNHDMPLITVVPVLNQGNFIERSIANVARSVLYGGSLAVLILLFFLRSLRSTLVIGLAIPISIMATFTLIYAGGLTINLMTLGGLALGVGMMVDNAIVVLENIFRRRAEEGDDDTQAAITGSGEVTTAIIASTITTLVIFLPLVFVQGVVGQLFGELALVVVFALIASLAVALSLVPMLASRMLRRRPEAREGRLARWAGDRFSAMEHGYRDLLGGVLRHRLLTVGLTALVLAGSLLLVPFLGREFMPPTDEGEVRISAEFEAGVRLDLADAETRRMEALVAEVVPGAVATVTSISAAGRRGNTSTTAQIQLSLPPATLRDQANTAIAEQLRSTLTGQVAGAELRVRAPQGQFLLERVLRSSEGLEVEIRGPDLAVLAALSDQVVTALGTVSGITDVETDLEEGLPQLHLDIDRARVADLGLSVRDVAELLETAVAGRIAGDFRPPGLSYRMLLQLADVERLELDQILDQVLRTPSGELVALRSLVSVAPGHGPAVIKRKDQQRTIQVTANLAGRDMGSVATEVQALLAAIPSPSGYDLRVGGSFAEQQAAFRELVVSFLLALLLVYMVLACQYESLRDPLVVMFSVPVAAIGVMLALFLTGSTLNVQSAIGCIMLGGIVVNNAILLVDQAGRLREEGRPVHAAVTEAGRRRLRPILMTTLTTILGLLPLALGIGEGADAQAPLARAVVGGLITSTLISLVLVPVVYTFFHREAAPETAA